MALLGLSLFILALLFTHPASSAHQSVSFYTARSDGRSILQWLQDAQTLANVPSVATGLYLCCGSFGIQDDGSLKRITDEDIATSARPLLQQNLTVHFVMSITDVSIASRNYHSAIQELAAILQEHRFTGYLCDYEPSLNYSRAHAEAYGEFLTSLSAALHTVNGQSGFCSAGWGILDYWDVYRTANVDIATSMTPTYNWLGNGQILRSFVSQEVAPGAMPVASVGAGIGTTIVPPYHAEWQYNWTEVTLHDFALWLKNDANIQRLDFWRSDIDYNYAANATAKWVFAVAGLFLQ
jgi:hypothetical protein